MWSNNSILQVRYKVYEAKRIKESCLQGRVANPGQGEVKGVFEKRAEKIEKGESGRRLGYDESRKGEDKNNWGEGERRKRARRSKNSERKS